MESWSFSALIPNLSYTTVQPQYKGDNEENKRFSYIPMTSSCYYLSVAHVDTFYIFIYV